VPELADALDSKAGVTLGSAPPIDAALTVSAKPHPLLRIALESFLIAGRPNDPAMMSSVVRKCFARSKQSFRQGIGAIRAFIFRRAMKTWALSRCTKKRFAGRRLTNASQTFENGIKSACIVSGIGERTNRFNVPLKV
jgi:hypothetical protein